MKRACSEIDYPARKRRARSLPEIGRSCKRPQPAFTSTPPSPSPSPTLSSFDLAQPLDARQQVDVHWAECLRSIPAWISNVSTCCNSFPTDDVQVLDTMSDISRLRDMKTTRRHSRSCSPTKKSSQYRNTVLKPANIFVDVVHILPPDIEALLPRGLRDMLSSSPPAPSSAAHTHTETSATTYEENHRRNARAIELADRVSQLAAVYRDECRELAGKPGSEPEYRTHLYGDVVEKLARFPPWRRALSANCSDKSWLASLKPPASTPILSLPWPPLSANSVATKPQEHVSFDLTQNLLRPNGNPFRFASPPASTEPSESSSASELDGTITTPKPDMTVGISREAFSPNHAGVLDYWQAGKVVLSDPHATQGDMRFPFLIIEAKGLATNSNLIGAQNQAAGGGTCAIRLLASLAAQDPKVSAPRIVFSCTTEGAIHELWVHFQVADEENMPKQHMACLGAWRTTLDRHANEFIAALAIILCWGVDVFFPQIKQVLDRVLSAAVIAG